MLLLSSLYSYIFLSDCKITTFYSIYKYLSIGFLNSKMNNYTEATSSLHISHSSSFYYRRIFPVIEHVKPC